MVPVDSAPPAHIVMKAFQGSKRSRRSSSCSAVVISRWSPDAVPDRMSDRDRTAVDVHPIGIRTMHGRAHDIGTAANASVHLEDVEIADGFMPLRRSSDALRRLDRAVEVVVRLRADQHTGAGCVPADRKPEGGRAYPESISRTAAAPSEICEEVPAVCTPPSSTGLSPASDSPAWSRACPDRDRPSGSRRSACHPRPGSAPAPQRPPDRSGPRPTPGSPCAARPSPNASRSSPGDQATALSDPLSGQELVRQVDRPTSQAGGLPAMLAQQAWRRVVPASSLPRRRRCRRRSRRWQSVPRSGGWPAGPTRTAHR